MKTCLVCAVFAAILAISGTSHAQCATDIDCKGDRICQGGRCVDSTPAQGQAPAPVPAPQPGYAPQPTPAPAPQPGYAPPQQPYYAPQQPAPQQQPGYPPPPPYYAPPQAAYTQVAPAPMPRVPQEKKSYFRINLEIRPFGFAWTRTEYDKDAMETPSGGYVYGKNPVVGVGITPGADFGLGLAYSYKRHATVGLRLLAGFASSKPRYENGNGDNLNENTEEKITTFRYGVLPYFEYAFLSGSVRPFLTFILGLEGEQDKGTYTYDDGYATGTVDEANTTNLFAFGIGGGVHFFAGDRASIDLWLLESVATGKRIDESRDEYDGTVDKTKYEHKILKMQTDLFLGLSIWL
jgi:hypothetical protein